MPAGIILVKFEGDWEKARATLAGLQGTSEFSRTTNGAFLVSWFASMGAADFAVYVLAPSLEAIRTASAEIRTRLREALGEACALTTTIVGSTIREQGMPGSYAKKVLERKLTGGEDELQYWHLDCFVLDAIDSILIAISRWEMDPARSPQFKKLKAALLEFLQASRLNEFGGIEEILNSWQKAGTALLSPAAKEA